MVIPAGDEVPVDETRGPIGTQRDRTEGGGTAARRRRRRVVGTVAVVAVSLGVLRLWSSASGGDVALEDAQRRLDRSATTLAPDSRVLRPVTGAYRYEGSGRESLSLPPREHGQGPSVPGVVTHLDDGCWTLRVDLNTDHWQDWTYCPVDGGLVEVGGTSWSRWDFVVAVSETTSTFRCEPASVVVAAGMRPGDRWDQECAGTSTGLEGEAVSSGTMTYIGPEPVEVGGHEVMTHRFRQERTVTGAQEGEQTTELWLAQTDGLPVRNDRRVRITTDTPIGPSTYTEEGSFRLVELEPQR